MELKLIDATQARKQSAEAVRPQHQNLNTILATGVATATLRGDRFTVFDLGSMNYSETTELNYLLTELGYMVRIDSYGTHVRLELRW